MDELKDLKEKLARFKTLWDESLNGNYRNQGELSFLSRKIRDMNVSDSFLNSHLSTTELINYKYALLLANYKK